MERDYRNYLLKLHARVLDRPSGSTHSVFAELLRHRVGNEEARLYLLAQPEALHPGLEREPPIDESAPP